MSINIAIDGRQGPERVPLQKKLPETLGLCMWIRGLCTGQLHGTF